MQAKRITLKLSILSYHFDKLHITLEYLDDPGENKNIN